MKNMYIKRAWCRTFQFGMKIGDYFVPYHMPKYISGAGSIEKLPGILKKKHLKNIMLVTDNNLMELGVTNSFLEGCKKKKIKVTVFSDVCPNPTDEVVEAGYKLFKANKCRGIIAIGGGSPMDCAKAIACKRVHPKKKVADFCGLFKVLWPIGPFWAVPTTSGTGSETTLAAVITEASTRHKAAIMDPFILPNRAVLDPALSKSMTPFQTVTTGMDALCHAVEAYTNATYNTKLENDLAKKAVKLIYENIVKAYYNGNDMEARENMQLASFYAGRAFTRGCTGYVHAIGHTISGLYDVPHGHAMAVILPRVMEQFGEPAYKKLAELADYSGLTADRGIANASDEAKSKLFIKWMDETLIKCQVPTRFDCILERDIPQMIRWADKEANPLYPVPVIWGDADFRKLINKLR